MGSSPSKKKNNEVSNMVRAFFAFEDACNRAAEKQQPNRGRQVVTEDHEEKQIQANGHVKSSEKHKNRANTTKADEEDDLTRAEASTKIQSAFRGYQERMRRAQETEMAIKIQRIYRRHSAVQKAFTEGKPGPVSPETASFAGPHPLAPSVVKQKSQPIKTWEKSNGKEDTPRKISLKKRLVGMGEETRANLVSFQDEITALKWNAERQLERALCGADFAGPRIALVSSNVPKGKMLCNIVKANVLTSHYDFDKDTFEELIDKIQGNLEAFKHGCKARSICIYCQGGPGFFYLRKSKVVTMAKLQKKDEQDQVRFFKELGNMMSKLDPQMSVIHVMGCNVLGNEKGQKLFDYLEDVVKPNQVRFEAPLELAPAGVEMIKTYFDFQKYTVWRRQKYSKTDVTV